MFKPLFWLFRVTGVAPNNSPRDKYFTTVALVVTVLTMYQGLITWKHPEQDTAFSKPVLVAAATFYSNGAIFIVSSYLKRISFSSITSQAYRPTPKFEVSLIAFTIIFYITRFYSILLRSGDLVHSLCRSINNCVIFIIMVQHMLLVRGLSLQFESLNERIKSFTSQTRANPLANFTGPLRSTLAKHWDLQDLVAKINSHYTLFYLINMAGKLIYTIDNLYWILIRISQGTGSTSFTHLFSISLTMMAAIAPMSICQYCSNKAQASVLLAHQLWNVDGSTDMMNEVKMFSLAMKKRPVKFTAGGVFTLDCRFLTKFAVTALTYLIIAVQLTGYNPTKGAGVVTTSLNTTAME